MRRMTPSGAGRAPRAARRYCLPRLTTTRHARREKSACGIVRLAPAFKSADGVVRGRHRRIAQKSPVQQLARDAVVAPMLTPAKHRNDEHGLAEARLRALRPSARCPWSGLYCEIADSEQHDGKRCPSTQFLQRIGHEPRSVACALPTTMLVRSAVRNWMVRIVAVAEPITCLARSESRLAHTSLDLTVSWAPPLTACELESVTGSRGRSPPLRSAAADDQRSGHHEDCRQAGRGRLDDGCSYAAQ